MYDEHEVEVSDVEAAWDVVEAREAENYEQQGDEDAHSGTDGSGAASEAGTDGHTATSAAGTGVADSQADAGTEPSDAGGTDKEYDEETGLYYDVAPQSWKAGSREDWKTLPASARKEVVRRERDFAQGIQRYSEAAQYGHRMHQMLQPMQPFFQAAGMDANQGLQSVLQTAAMLMGGGPQQKAQAAAQIIQQYGVDIETLDGLLAGDPNTQQQQSEVEQRIQQALQPYQQFMQQVNQSQQRAVQSRQQSAVSEVDKFAQDPKNTYYAEVREDMATLLDLAAQRGQEMTLQQAYDQACQYNERVRNAIEQKRLREDEERKRAASSSVTGDPGGSQQPSEPETIREALLRSWEGV
jgi:hypothetical protein